MALCSEIHWLAPFMQNTVESVKSPNASAGFVAVNALTGSGADGDGEAQVAAQARLVLAVGVAQVGDGRAEDPGAEARVQVRDVLPAALLCRRAHPFSAFSDSMACVNVRCRFLYGCRLSSSFNGARSTSSRAQSGRESSAESMMSSMTSS